MRCYLGNVDDLDSIVFMDVSTGHVELASEIAIELSMDGTIIPILSDLVLKDVIDMCHAMHCDDWEVISYGGDGIFYTYSLAELSQFDYPINVLGSVGIVLRPNAPIKILFPSAFGIMEKR